MINAGGKKTHKNFRTSFSKDLFENLYSQLLHLNVDEIITYNATVRGLDGTDCKLHFGDLQKMVSLDIWSPDWLIFYNNDDSTSHFHNNSQLFSIMTGNSL
jgi:hypothetical protein